MPGSAATPSTQAMFLITNTGTALDNSNAEGHVLINPATGLPFSPTDGSQKTQVLNGFLASPWGVAVTVNSGAGTTTAYDVVAVLNGVDGIPSSTVAVSGAATPNNTLTWYFVPGATAYKIIRTVGGGSQGLIATINSPYTLTYTDTGGAASAYTAATSNPPLALAVNASVIYTTPQSTVAHRNNNSSTAGLQTADLATSGAGIPASLVDTLGNTLPSKAIQPTTTQTIVDFDVFLLTDSTSAAATCTVSIAFWDAVGFTVNNGANTFTLNWAFPQAGDVSRMMSLTTQATALFNNGGTLHTYYMAVGRLSVDTGGSAVYAAITKLSLPATANTWPGVYVNATLRT